MLAGLDPAGVQLLLTVAACAALGAHAVVGTVHVHTVPTSLTQLLQPQPYMESMSGTHSPLLAPITQHHPTSLLPPVTRVPPHSIRESHTATNGTVLVTETHTHTFAAHTSSVTHSRRHPSGLAVIDMYHPGRLSLSHICTHSAIHHLMRMCSAAPSLGSQ